MRIFRCYEGMRLWIIINQYYDYFFNLFSSIKKHEGKDVFVDLIKNYYFKYVNLSDDSYKMHRQLMI